MYWYLLPIAFSVNNIRKIQGIYVILKGSISIMWILINLRVTFNEKGNTADHNIKMCKASNP